MTTQPDLLCPVCGHTALPLFYAGDQRMFRCSDCHLAFVYPTPSDAFLSDFYSRFHRMLEEGGGYEMREDRMSADFPAKLAKIGRYAALSDIELLDVGCGKGFFVKACAERQITAKGIDLSDTAVAYARQTLGVSAFQGRIEDCARELGPFDVVTCWATIEHLPDPARTLKSIYSVLKPGGLLFLDTGIGFDWLDRLLPGMNQWYDPPQHLFVFSAAAMHLTIQDAGLIVEDFDACFERNRIRRLARMWRGYVAAFGLRAVSELTRSTGSGPFLFTRFPLGNLMSVVCRKPDL